METDNIFITYCSDDHVILMWKLQSGEAKQVSCKSSWIFSHDSSLHCYSSYLNFYISFFMLLFILHLTSLLLFYPSTFSGFTFFPTYFFHTYFFQSYFPSFFLPSSLPSHILPIFSLLRWYLFQRRLMPLIFAGFPLLCPLGADNKDSLKCLCLPALMGSFSWSHGQGEWRDLWRRTRELYLGRSGATMELLSSLVRRNHAPSILLNES